MAVRTIAAAGLLAALSVPALAGISVIGNSGARSCYEAADSSLMPGVRDIERCDLALREEPLDGRDRVATYVNRGILLLRRGDTGRAIADFDRAIALDPDQPESYLNKGAALMRRNEADGAVRLFTIALERNTRRPAIAHYGRAVAHEDLGNVRQAWLDYRRASELDPEWDDPRLELRRFQVVSQ